MTLAHATAFTYTQGMHFTIESCLVRAISVATQPQIDVE